MSRRDVAHCMNVELERQGNGNKFVTVNCAVEESKIASRDCGKLLSHDKFIRDHITKNDILVVSMGGNDIALSINPFTICNMLGLICCTTTSCIANCSCGCDIPVACSNPCCCGGSCVGCLSNACAWPYGLGYFIHLFKTKIQDVLARIVDKQLPKVIAVCMIYYPSEDTDGSWADRVLGILGYNKNPSKLQHLISHIFVLATQKIKIPGTTVIGIPLFKVLNGKTFSDYEQRVEPSATGGEKMAQIILSELGPFLSGSYQGSPVVGETSAVVMGDR